MGMHVIALISQWLVVGLFMWVCSYALAVTFHLDKTKQEARKRTLWVVAIYIIVNLCIQIVRGD